MPTTYDSMKNPVQSKSTITISGTLMLHVRQMYISAVENFQPDYYPRKGINFGTSHGIAAYVVAVEAIEAFLNETFMVLSRPYIKEAQLWKLSRRELEALDKKSLKKRINQIPQLLVGKSLPPANAAVQEMKLLIDVRNKLVHYKMDEEWHDFMETFLQRNIGLNALEPIGYEPWPEILNTSEGIRWANNTASEMAIALYQLLPDEYRNFQHQIENFKIIDDSLVKNAFALRGISPYSSHIPGVT